MIRIFGLIGSLALMSACSGPNVQLDNSSATGVAEEQANEAKESATPNTGPPVQPTPEPQTRPCLTQNGVPVTHKLKAIGTEPFWAAEVEGRCITYKTPEDQQGTRVWTKVTISQQETTWDGALRAKQFQLTIRPKADCSDGMSDKIYPLEAVLRVDGETRNGCAEKR